ncbi:MAG: glycosyltransferase family 4 protein [Firmicutes bacterium]|nr:glycosyltransferase family 4 protein [Bacillota bacterium]
MRIGFDLRPLQLSSSVMGIGVYIKNLVKSISAQDRENRYVFLTVEGREIPDIDFAPGFDCEFAKVKMTFENQLNIITDKMNIHKVVDQHSLDIVHFTSPFELKIHFDLKQHRKRSILTIYDLTPKFFSDIIFVKKRALLKPVFNHLLSCVPIGGHFLSISENTKKDMVKLMKIPQEKITVTHLGRDELFQPVEDTVFLESVRRKYTLPEHFALYVGGISPHKNLNSLLEALVLLNVEYHINIPLVIVGKADGFHFQALKERVEYLKLTDRVHFTGYVPDEELAALYSQADLFVMPSLYEGFGLPLLEAMACGAPCAVSGTSSFPEIAGSAAVLFDPKNIDSIAEAMHRVLCSDELKAELKKKGPRKAKLFSWDKTASQTIEAYKKMKKNL